MGRDAKFAGTVGGNTMTRKKRLFCAIPHAPAFDSCFPLLERLHERGRVEPVILLGPRIRQTEPRVEQAFAEKRTPYRRASFLRLELGAVADILRADAVLTHSDPVAYGDGKFRPRDIAVLRSNKPLIFVQHGMLQGGLHEGGYRTDWAYHAQLMLLWAPLPDPNAAFFQTPIADRIRVTGLIKTNRRPPWGLQNQLRDALGRNWRQTVLICHNYGFDIGRYPNALAEKTFAEWEKVVASRQDTLFLIRSHRGKAHGAIDELQASLAAKFPNVVLSQRHQGLMQMATIHDVLSVVDRVVTHPSTVILDALYQGLPVAIFDRVWPGMECLPLVQTALDLQSYLDHPDPLSFAKPVFDTYGDVSRNLDTASDLVEKHLESL